MSMFTDSVRQDAQSTHQRLANKLTSWRESAEAWFDGSVDSVDRRLEKCSTLIATVDAAIGRLPLGDSSPFITAAAELSADKRSLTSLREDLLTGASGREAGTILPGRKFATDEGGASTSGYASTNGALPGDGLSGGLTGFDPDTGSVTQQQYGTQQVGSLRQAKRWIELESRKFVADNIDAAHILPEITERAYRYAELKTSTLPAEASRAITAAFTLRVARLSQQLPKQRMAAAAPQTIPNLPDELLFM